MDYTYATVAVPDAAKADAQADFPDYFTSQFQDADGEPFWVTSGPFANSELEQIVNDVTWEKRIVFGQDAQAALAKWGLIPVPPQETSIETEE
jgi:hypothetical protein